VVDTECNGWPLQTKKVDDNEYEVAASFLIYDGFRMSNKIMYMCVCSLIIFHGYAEG